jgi:hypothetical protein
VHPAPRVPWYEAVVAYVILVPAVISWFVGAVLLVSYWSCSENSSGMALGEFSDQFHGNDHSRGLSRGAAVKRQRSEQPDENDDDDEDERQNRDRTGVHRTS